MDTRSLKRISATMLLFLCITIGASFVFIFQGYIPLDVAPTSTKTFDVVFWSKEPLKFSGIIFLLFLSAVACAWIRALVVKKLNTLE